MKGLRSFLVFNTKGFFEGKRLAYLSHSDWYEYTDGKKTDRVLGVSVEVVITDDNTTYSNQGVSNVYEKLRIKLPLLSSAINWSLVSPGKEVRFIGLKATVYGDYSQSLSLTAESFSVVNNDKKN